MSGKAAFGTQLQRGNGADPEVFTAVAGVVSIGGPGFSMETIDVTAHDSAGGYRETVPSFKSAGEVSLELNFDPSSSAHDQASGILADFEARVLRNWKLVFPTTPAETYGFAAYVTGFEPSAPADGKLSASCTLTTSGPVVQS